MREKKLSIFHYEGFWGCMDTYKEKQALDDMYANGRRPWVVWKTPGSKRPSLAPQQGRRRLASSRR